MSDHFESVRTIEWTEDVYSDQPAPGCSQVRQRIGERRMSCKVAVKLDVQQAARTMGRKAATSKGGKCCDGLLTVKRLSPPEEVGYDPLI